MLDLVAGVWSNDSSKQLHSTIKLREILSLESPNPRIDQVIESGVVPRLLEFMQRDYDPSLQDEAAWVVAIIASGTVEHTKAVVDLGALPIFLQLLGDSSVDDVRAKAIWALGSVAATSVMYRDLVLHSGALLRILPWVCLSSDLPILRDAAWTIARLCGGQPQAPFEKLAPALPGLELLVRLNDEETTEQACIALYHLSSSCRGIQIQSIIETGVVPKLVALLMDSSSSVVALALDIVGNIVTGDTQQTQCVIHCGALPHLANLLTQNHMESIKMNACKTVSRITAGTEEQIQVRLFFVAS
ncbi:hypothetical protein N665_0062s0105 [Sinapis alba]|nr:hypothetical protein N665_0062s0105 [Sinapis alba]